MDFPTFGFTPKPLPLEVVFPDTFMEIFREIKFEINPIDAYIREFMELNKSLSLDQK
jgi:hypothetical protein